MSKCLHVKPSEIRFSQYPIAAHWRQEKTKIGTTLDDLLLGKITVCDIPKITVYNLNGSLYSSDNRRLWVFKELEARQRCETIMVAVGKGKINPRKLTTKNHGASIRIRGDPGGEIWKKWQTKTVHSNQTENRNMFTACSGHQTDFDVSNQDTMDLSELSVAITDSRTTNGMDTKLRARDIWYCQTEIISNGKRLGDILDSWILVDWSKYYVDLDVFKINTRSWCTLNCETLWLLKNLEIFGISPEINLTVIDNPIQKSEWSEPNFSQNDLKFDLNSPIGRTKWKNIGFLKSLNLKSDFTKIAVSDMYFTTPTISDTFEKISIAKVLTNVYDTYTVPRNPRVVKFNERFYTLDNEILWVLKEIEKVKGPLILSVEVKIEMDETLFHSFASDDISQVELIQSNFNHTDEEDFILQYIKRLST